MARQLILARRLIIGDGAAIDGGAVLITDGLVQAVGPAAGSFRFVASSVRNRSCSPLDKYRFRTSQSAIHLPLAGAWAGGRQPGRQPLRPATLARPSRTPKTNDG